ncbi:MAG: hypothetical protein CMP34_03790 [Rickettsiales bacterium]|nr:hypothetical protein [Rickettsiales bacterium]|tara:strand:- start:190 stop:954 length:765 start_codon:yes stop_codon:yes gene_type:complete
MYKFKFKDLIFLTNRRQIQKEVIFLFYGIGLSSEDFRKTLYNNKSLKQIIIAELPGHNNIPFKKYDDTILEFTKKIYLFIKKKNIKNIIFFSHSLGGLVPILLYKYFFKKKIRIKKFINYEGNLTEQDTEMVTKKTASYKESEFFNKFQKLLIICKQSDKLDLNLWYKSMCKTSVMAFYFLSRDAVKYSKGDVLLRYFKIFFKKKIYLHGSLSNKHLPKYIYGSVRQEICGCGHFGHYENLFEFNKIFNKLVIR